MDLAEEDHTGDIPFLACHIEGVDYQFYVLLLMLVLVTWLREYLSHLYTVECSFTPNLYGILWGKVSMWNLYLRSGKLSSTFLWNIYTKYLEFFIGDLCIHTHLFMYAIIYLYHYEFMGINFILWIVIQDFFLYFILQVIQASAMESSFIWLTCLFDGLLTLCWGFFCLFSSWEFFNSLVL